ncbi:BnaC04g08600D [Brassica napus]|uniref:BnaC04g08600D protein n=1 Tax=Brassica napus TaxID=3708 RepID=A0A078H6M5_BRANA|nr:BnaC04g08600D [Brassica napus]
MKQNEKRKRGSIPILIESASILHLIESILFLVSAIGII